jgi:hypothetical protein
MEKVNVVRQNEWTKISIYEAIATTTKETKRSKGNRQTKYSLRWKMRMRYKELLGEAKRGIRLEYVESEARIREIEGSTAKRGVEGSVKVGKRSEGNRYEEERAQERKVGELIIKAKAKREKVKWENSESREGKREEGENSQNQIVNKQLSAREASIEKFVSEEIRVRITKQSVKYSEISPRTGSYILIKEPTYSEVPYMKK